MKPVRSFRDVNEAMAQSMRHRRRSGLYLCIASVGVCAYPIAPLAFGVPSLLLMLMSVALVVGGAGMLLVESMNEMDRARVIRSEAQAWIKTQIARLDSLPVDPARRSFAPVTPNGSPSCGSPQPH